MTARDTTTDPRGWLEDHLGPLTSCDAMFCVPVIEPPTARHAEQWNLGRELLVVDHTPELAWKECAAEKGWRYVPVGRNLGTGGAWNIGRQILLDEYRPQDLLVLMSAYCEFPQGLDAVRWELRYNASWKGVQVNGYAWHLIALSGALFSELGDFDENFGAGYWGDNDFVYRGILAGHFLAGADSFHAIDLDATPPRSGGALRSKRLEDFSYKDYAGYFRAKWLGDAGSEQSLTPFGLPVPTSWWSPRYRPTVEEDGTPGWLPFVEGAA